jgi:MFS transporter, UMF1 family
MQTASRKVVNGWAMYDWANSVYNLVITTTFFPIYFVAVTKGGNDGQTVRLFGRDFVNSSLYDYTLAAAYLVVALLYPILTSIADTRGNKKNFMRFFCYMGGTGCLLLVFFTGDTLVLGLLAFMLAAMGYAGGLVFYNAYLPEIAAPEDRDRISAKGFSYGYVGSVLMQLVGFALVVMMKGNEGWATRITFLLVGIWWIAFAQITFARLPSPALRARAKGNVLKDGFKEIGKVYGQVKHMPVLKRFLRGFFFYSMGVQTVMLAATLFGSKVLKLPDTNLIITVVIIQLVAIRQIWEPESIDGRHFLVDPDLRGGFLCSRPGTAAGKYRILLLWTGHCCWPGDGRHSIAQPVYLC